MIDTPHILYITGGVGGGRGEAQTDSQRPLHTFKVCEVGNRETFPDVRTERNIIPHLTSSSSAFQRFLPQICRWVSEIKSVVLIRSCWESHSFSASIAPWGQCRVLASWYRGQDCTTCSGDCGPVPHGQSSLFDLFSSKVVWSIFVVTLLLLLNVVKNCTTGFCCQINIFKQNVHLRVLRPFPTTRKENALSLTLEIEHLFSLSPVALKMGHG